MRGEEEGEGVGRECRGERENSVLFNALLEKFMCTSNAEGQSVSDSDFTQGQGKGREVRVRGEAGHNFLNESFNKQQLLEKFLNDDAQLKS